MKKRSTRQRIDYTLHQVVLVESQITTREEAPRQGDEGAPDAWIIIDPALAEGLSGMKAGQDVVVLTWLHQSKRDVLKLHPRWDINNPVTGVFSTRSPDRPNPIGLHQVTILEVDQNRIKVGPMEAINGTPVIDIKPVI
jgi:tRNA-Thr(GGU) m(6)t(6)A37 methyltransferase TsaA